MTVSYHFLIQTSVVGKDDLPKGSTVPISTVFYYGHILPKGKVRRGSLGASPEGLALFWSINAVQAYSFRPSIVLHVNRIAVNHANYFTGEVRVDIGSGERKSENQREK